MKGSTLTLKGNSIKAANLTINGEKVTDYNEMYFTQSINLNEGQTLVTVHIEPTDTTKSTIFKDDGGSINKNTKNYVIDVINKTISESK
ncbi:hypothetical protein ACFWM3_24850 [Gottfriedia sp. NPDC058432]|uniref:hypothetical protein n=1 Tax=Gottfriedia sp. NPDC058432 TaxID=3346497 RepID=UPI00364B1F7F